MNNKNFDGIRIKCPYCGVEAIYYIERETHGPQVILCDIDNAPGCDRYFAVEVNWYPRITTYALTEPE